jgi:hypothetical protein
MTPVGISPSKATPYPVQVPRSSTSHTEVVESGSAAENSTGSNSAKTLSLAALGRSFASLEGPGRSVGNEARNIPEVNILRAKKVTGLVFS